MRTFLCDGKLEGFPDTLGFIVGICDGWEDGKAVLDDGADDVEGWEEFDGVSLGIFEGTAVGWDDGCVLVDGTTEGIIDGSALKVGCPDGCALGIPLIVGLLEGWDEGTADIDGELDGWLVGQWDIDGAWLGFNDGCALMVGESDGYDRHRKSLWDDGKSW